MPRRREGDADVEEGGGEGWWMGEGVWGELLRGGGVKEGGRQRVRCVRGSDRILKRVDEVGLRPGGRGVGMGRSGGLVTRLLPRQRYNAFASVNPGGAWCSSSLKVYPPCLLRPA